MNFRSLPGPIVRSHENVRVWRGESSSTARAISRTTSRKRRRSNRSLSSQRLRSFWFSPSGAFRGLAFEIRSFVFSEVDSIELPIIVVPIIVGEAGEFSLSPTKTRSRLSFSICRTFSLSSAVSVLANSLSPDA